MTRARAALLATAAFFLVGIGTAPGSGAATAASARRHGTVILFVVEHVSFEELMSVPEITALARAGGAALMATNDRYRDDPEKVYEALGSGAELGARERALLTRTLCTHGVGVSGKLFGVRAPLPKLLESEITSLLWDRCLGSMNDRFIVEWVLRAGHSEAAASADRRRDALAEVGRTIGHEVRRSPSGRTLVLVVSPTPSADMVRRGDEVSPLVVAAGRRDRLLRSSGAMDALRSDTTRQTGLVSNLDVAPTILDFFGIPIPSEMDGQPIRVTDDPAPYSLHRLHLEQRRIRLPIQFAEVGFVAGTGAVAIVVLLIQARRRRLPDGVVRIMRFVALSVAALPIPLILGGLLPRLTYWVVVPFLVVSVVSLAVLAGAARWPGPLGPFTFLGLLGLAVVVTDATLGWRGARIPLLGGTMFDGARFYGLPNAFLALLLASAMFVAATLPAFTGFLVLVGAALFAGFPSLGADIGGATTVFFAAGLWWVLGTRRRFGVRELAFVAGVAALGLGLVLLANRYLPGTPTHATRFVAHEGNSLSGAVHELGDRLSVGIGQVANAPAAMIPLLGLPIILALALRRPGPIGWGLNLAGERWRHLLVVLTLAGVIAFVVNDTGVAAAAPVFLYAMSGMAYPAFLASEGGPPRGDRA